MIPNWHIAYDRLVYWNKFGRPDVLTIRGTSLRTWCIDPAKAAALDADDR